jgi:hypothetical protein
MIIFLAVVLLLGWIGFLAIDLKRVPASVAAFVDRHAIAIGIAFITLTVLVLSAPLLWEIINSNDIAYSLEASAVLIMFLAGMVIMFLE